MKLLVGLMGCGKADGGLEIVGISVGWPGARAESGFLVRRFEVRNEERLIL